MPLEAVGDAALRGLSTSVSQLVERAFLGLMQNSKEGVAILRSKFCIGFERYVSTTLSKCTNVKTLVSSNNPVTLERAYEPANLAIKGGANIHVDQFLDNLEEIHSRSLITATLGAGKSFTMKYIYSVLARSEILNRIPIFVELRYIDFSSETLVSYIKDQLQIHNSFSTERSVLAGLKAGIFSLILDGFDEVQLKHRPTAQKQILKISNDFPDCIIVISSRPDSDRFLSWHAFTEYNVQPLSLPQMNSMIRRIEYDEGDKRIFLQRVESGLWKTHEKLLSNPLLASMMLLTFREFQDIPSKMHVFYGTAFDVLFRRHDTIKPDYHREFRTSLELDDFKKVFMTFCFSSFVDKKFSFNESSFQKYANLSFEYETISSDSPHFKHDLISNICIMQQEGDLISFIHRSFQEYFTAMFLSKRSISESYQFIDSIINDAPEMGGGCVRMMIDIDSEEFERKYFIKRLELLNSESDDIKTDKDKIKFLSSRYIVGKIEEDDGNFYLTPWRASNKSDKGNFHLIQAVGDIYGMPQYNVFDRSKDGWWTKLKKEHRELKHLTIVNSDEITLQAARQAGLINYANELIGASKRLSRKLAERHEKKRRLLSSSLRKH